MRDGLVVGVDVGLSGALSFLTPAGDLTVHDMPVIRAGKRGAVDRIELARLIDTAGPIAAAYVEHSGVRPGEGAVGAFSYGHGRGVIIGILTAHFIPIFEPHPVTWKKAVGIRAGSGKDASLAFAKAIWQKDAGLFARLKDNGRADSALIGLYGWKHHNNKLAA